ncbi:multiple PDZ domain protein-like isoform X3 [Pomacea canaliculata]|uniref:multiple PDZ domain protein-like isoform X3 n=1 Tax=Pomacea canaliculata TaxID=400727 RepID=UPI000D7274CE|nr:multiple PDZ domain protein-like isoform X3 [Pomacea canaliculata]
MCCKTCAASSSVAECKQMLEINGELFRRIPRRLNRDGRLREGDQLLAIDGQPLDISHQQAIHILQNSQGPVEIVVARGPIPPAAGAAPEAVDAEGGAAEGVIETHESNNQLNLPPDQAVSVSVEDLGTSQGEKADMVLNADWTQLEVIDLINDGTGLGFGIIGGRSTGVVVKTILPGGVADLEGHLRSGDHILQIGDVNVRGMSSEQVALVLRQSGSHVRLIVARSILEPPPYQIPNAPIIPTEQLDEHIAHINLLMEQSEARAAMDELALQQLQMYPHLSSIMGQVQVHHQPYDPQDMPEMEVFEVDLIKDTRGLGITIAGYVGGDNSPDEVSGIFVKSISPGSAAAQDGRIHVNDQIIEVDGRSLQGYTNHQAVEVLRNTGQSVLLCLVRFQHGPKYEKLQQYLAQANQNSSAMAGQDMPAVSNPTYELENGQVDLEDVTVTDAEDDYSGELRSDVEAAIKSCWERIVGPDCEVVIAQLSKFKEGGGLGISLEGTVDVENGQEVRPHHYIGSIRPDGPVGLNGRLKTNDELLEVNGKRLLGLNHVSVVEILKHSPQHVRLVCARRKSPPQADPFPAPPSSVPAAPFIPSASFQDGVGSTIPGTERLIKAKSEQALSTSDSAPATSSLNKAKSRSLEPLTGLAMWSSEPVVIELEKGDRGLGFSILDYQDPMNPNETVIVIRSLVPGGVAQQDGRLVPGDRLVFVNNTYLEQASLDEAAQALKGAPKGIVRIGVAKPLPLSDSPFRREQQFSFGAQNHQVSETTPFPSALVSELTSVLKNHVGTSAGHTSEESRSGGVSPSIVQGHILVGSWDSSSSDTDIKTNRGSMMQRKDSFYESDEDLRTPRRTSPRKQKMEPEEMPPSYESAVEVSEKTTATALMSSDVKPPLPPPPLQPKSSPSERPAAYASSYENVPKVEQDLIFNMLQSVKTESLAPLPSYEEAVLGFGETDSTSEAPPVPPRAEFQENTVTHLLTVDVGHAPAAAEEFRLSDLEPEQPLSSPDSPHPLMDTSSPPSSAVQTVSGGRVGRARGPPPPLPPKPRLPKPIPGKQDATPPLPATSPPPPQAVPPISPPVFPSTPPLRPAPSSPRHDPESRLGGRIYHYKSASQDSSASSSSDHAVASAAAALGGAASDLRNLSSPPASPRTASPRLSPMGSPLLRRSEGVSSDLEKTIKVSKGSDQLGVTVETVDRGVNGCLVKTITKGGAVDKDGHLQVGDYIVSINNESLRHITNAQARAILRRTSLLSTDISITYIPGSSVPTHGSMTPRVWNQVLPM